MTTGPASPRLQPAAVLAAVLLAGAVLAAGRQAMAWGPWIRVVLPVLWLGGWSLATLGLGRPLLRAVLGPGEALSRSTLMAAAVGAAALSWLATLAAAAHVLRPGLLAALLLACAAWGAVVLGREGRLADLARRATSPGWLLALPLVCGGFVLLLLTTPPVMFDVANYHLAFPERWLAAGGFLEFPRHGFSYYPAAHSMLWTYALATIGAWGASAVNAWFGFLASAAVWRLARRLAGRPAAGWAVVCFVTTPAVLEVAAFAAADLAVAAWAAAAMVAVIGSAGRPRRAALAGLLVGSAAAAKYLALATVALPVAAALLVVSWRRGGRRAVVAATVLGMTAAVPLLPWLARNLVWTGNPLYPYLQSLLGGPAAGFSIGAERLQNGAAGGGPWHLAATALGAFVQRSLQPLGQGGWIGLLWLILLPTAALTSMRRSRDLAAIWLATLLGLLTWGALVQFGRFALPALAWGAPLAGAAAAALTGSGGRLQRGATTALLLTLASANATVLGTPLNLDRLAVTANVESDEAYLASWLDYAPLLPAIERDVPPDGAILLVAETRSLYIPRRVLVEDPYRPPWLGELARDGADPAAALRAMGVTHVLVNQGDMNRVAALRGASSYWEGLAPAARAAVARFLTSEVEVQARAGGVWLARLLPPAKPAATGAGAAVTPPASGTRTP